jgi:hypothetical protein
METLIVNVALLGAIALIVILCARAAGRLRRAGRDDRPLPIGEMMGRRGIALADAAAAGDRGEIALAARICAACATQEQCRVWLAEGKTTGFEEFCPNAVRLPLFEQAKAHKQAPEGHPAESG